MLTNHEKQILSLIDDTMSYDQLLVKLKLSEIELMRGLQWLSNKGLVNIKETVKTIVELDANGRTYKEKGLPEKRFLNSIYGQEDAELVMTKAGLKKDEMNICIGQLRAKAAIVLSKQDKRLMVRLSSQGEKLKERETLEEKFLKKDFPFDLTNLKYEEKYAYNQLIKRKDILKKSTIKLKTLELTPEGKKLKKKGLSSEEHIESITPNVIKSKVWKGRKFRRYDVSINVPKIYSGRRHFVNQAVEYIRKIWLELGFQEMQGTIVQSAFWDLDALFVPQDHPARTEQDTFYLKDPKNAKKLPPLSKEVKKVHEYGGDTGSTGWGGTWSREIASENLLRTHTTVLSAQTLHRLKKGDLPAKFFSVGKVFRNEAVDWKHLFELNQVEGIVVDPDANLRHLIGYLKEFFKKMGFSDVRVRPGHFPYTEASCEIDVFHPKKKQWVEFGGSGIFRPEVTKPLIGFECPVLAWGLGMERIIAEYWGIDDIRELYKNDLRQLREMRTYMR
jgi:phenylalanyl-tRNA synthetase alpha chain